MKKKPNIIILLFDTLRADRLGFMGYKKNTSPNMDKLAKKSLIFTNCFAPSSWTLPSHASLFTGALPNLHQVLHINSNLNSSIKTIAELMHQKKYNCFHISRNPFTYVSNLSRGSKLIAYDKTPDNFLPRLKSVLAYRFNFIFKIIKLLIKKNNFPYNKQEHKILNDIENIIEKNKKNHQPYFIFANFLTCHAPEGFTQQDIKAINPEINFSEVKKIFLKYLYTSKDITAISKGNKIISKKEAQLINLIYDASVRYLDRIIHNLIMKIIKDENNLLIITSDHGEILGEYNSNLENKIFGHFAPLSPELLHIPLLIYNKNIKPKRISHLVSLIDILPTLAKISNFKKPFYCQGINLLNQTIKKRKYIESQLIKAYSYLHKSSVSMQQGCLTNHSATFVYKKNTISYYARQKDKNKENSIFIPKYNIKKLSR